MNAILLTRYFAGTARPKGKGASRVPTRVDRIRPSCFDIGSGAPAVRGLRVGRIHSVVA